MKRRSGFTLVEMMTVIAVILILAGMLFVGARYMSASAKRDRTRTALQTLRGMLTEREAAKDAKTVKTEINALFPALPLPPAYPQLNVSAGLIVDTAQASRYPAVGNAVGITQTLISMLIATPANKQILSNFPKRQFLEPPSSGATAYNPPILLDGYENPIIVVPSGGLAGVSLNGVVQPVITSPDGKPFFASAGPDGNFQTGDDNVYSFEN